MNERKKLQSVVRDCLWRCYIDFRRLKTDRRAVIVDRSVDFSTAADQRISRSMRDYFHSLPESYSLLSEERTSEPSGDTRWTVIADELDGTANLVSGGDLPFGPIIALASTTDPSFSDILAMGFLVLPSGDLYEAYRGGGGSVTPQWTSGNNESHPVSTSKRTQLSGEISPSILVDQYMLGGCPELAQVLWSTGYPGDFRSWAYHITLIARGAYDLAVTGDHCALNDEKRATAEELAGGYLLLKEAGGTVTTWEGDRLGPMRVGMVDGATFDVVAAASPRLAKDASAEIYGVI